MTSIILAPIRDLNSASPEEKVKELIDSNFIDEKSEYSYLKYFYLEPHDSMPYKNGGIVDLAKCFSVRKNSYENPFGPQNPAVETRCSLEYCLLKLRYIFIGTNAILNYFLNLKPYLTV